MTNNDFLTPNMLNMPEPLESSERRVVYRRPTFESELEVVVDLDERREIQSDSELHFLSHMLEHISMRGCINIAVRIGLPRYKLTHVVCEDLGITLGYALIHLLANNVKNGIGTFGEGSGVLDEALSRVVISVEGRPGLFIDNHLGRELEELVEDMQAHDLVAFLEGFSQGFKATVHVDILKGRNPHHIWESVFRALGEALRGVFAPCEWRRGLIAAIKRTLY
jgi:imidazoleglycerol-phosphate dehydratase